VIAVKAEKAIRELLSSMPEALVASTAATAAAPAQLPWANAMRHYMLISATHKIIIIYRAALARGGTGPERAAAQTACVGAAKTIVDELDRGSRQSISMQSLWTIPYHGLAAAVVLALEMMKTRNLEERIILRREIDKARQALEKLSPTSRVARRSLQVCEPLGVFSFTGTSGYPAGDGS
jgi:hypothetical protein